MEEGYNYVKKAEENLENAQEALFKPQEDIVSFVVCKNSQFAVESFLKGFLLQNEIDPTPYKTIDDLYDQCKAIDVLLAEIRQ